MMQLRVSVEGGDLLARMISDPVLQNSERGACIQNAPRYKRLQNGRMRCCAALSLVAASLIGSASFSECANAQSDPYALDRLFLDPNDSTPLYDILTFNSETEVANYYGKATPEAKLAAQFFRNYTGDSANMLFTRFPDEPGRAHLYGADISDLTLGQLQAINGTVKIVSEGYHYSGHINLSKVTTFAQAASRVTAALNKNLPIAANVTGSSIAPVTVSFTGSSDANVLTVNEVSSGNIQVGSIISGHGVPPGAQISAQLSGTPGGMGVYSLFLHGLSKVDVPTPTESMTDTYGVLTVGSVSSGTVKVGQEVTGTGVLPYTAIEDNLSGSGAESTWVVNKTQAMAGENLTMDGASLFVRFTSITGATQNRGFLFLQQSQNFNYATSSLTYMSGSAAKDLGMTPKSGAYLSSPGLVVLPGSESYCPPPSCTTAAAFMSKLAAEDPDWSTFQNTYLLASIIPPGTPPALEAWAESTDGQYTYLEGYSSTTPPIVDSLDPNVAQSFATLGATVPELSTWAMLLLGLASLGLARYRPARSSSSIGNRIGVAERQSAEVEFVR
jgi:hypothetical protein